MSFLVPFVIGASDMASKSVTPLMSPRPDCDWIGCVAADDSCDAIGVRSWPIAGGDSTSWKLREESPLRKGAKDDLVFSRLFSGVGGGGPAFFRLPTTVPSRLIPPKALFLRDVFSSTAENKQM